MRDETSALSVIQQRLALAHIRQLAQTAGVSDVFRLTAYYPAGDAYHSVATLCAKSHTAPNIITMIYEGLLDNKAFEHAIDATKAQAFMRTLHRLRLDHIKSATNWQNMPYVWYIEVASGTHYTTLVLLPDIAELPYSAISNTIGDYVPQAIRRVAR